MATIRVSLQNVRNAFCEALRYFWNPPVTNYFLIQQNAFSDTPPFLEAFMGYNWQKISYTLAKLHSNMNIFKYNMTLTDPTEQHLYIALPTLDENLLINQVRISSILPSFITLLFVISTFQIQRSRSINHHAHWILFFPRMSSSVIASKLPTYTPLVILGEYPTKV